MIAVGTFLPQIEIWNLDVLDTVQPDIILGEVSNLEFDDMGNALPVKNFKKKADNQPRETLQGHTDAVLGLNINPF